MKDEKLRCKRSLHFYYLNKIGLRHAPLLNLSSFIFHLSLLLFVALPFAASAQKVKHPTQQELLEMVSQQQKLNEFYRILGGNYLDTINYSAVVEKGIVSMLAELDPHSVYMTAAELKASREDLGGSFSGIGVEFNVLNDTIIVVNTIAGGPAERVGVMPNDRIVTIDGKSSIGMKRTDVPKYLRGPRGTKVDISVYRRGAEGPLDFTITRDNIPVNTVDAAYKVDGSTGYIKVNRFGATTGSEFAEAFAKFGEVDGLIVDLRGNGGGYLPEAIRMSEFFLDKGDLIVSTEGNMYPTQTYSAARTGQYNKGRLIVLVDESSASASEIVAGAVQDWDRGVIVGRPTFGKGLVQREFGLEDGSALRITISKYLTPTGRAIQRPYERGHKEEYYEDYVRRYNGLAQDTLDTTGPEYHTLKTGRPVYGGGGIYPDVYVASDTTGYSAYWAKLVRSGQLHEFIQTYLDTNRARLAAEYPSFDDYLDGFDGASLIPQLADFAAARGTERDEEGLATSRSWLSTQLKALIAQRLWDTTAYYRVTHGEIDEVFKEAYGMMLRWGDTTKAKMPFTPVSSELIQRLSAD